MKVNPEYIRHRYCSMTVEIDKLEIDFRDRPLTVDYFLRAGQSTTLLFLHGLGCSKNDFLEATKREILRTHTLVVFDFPGHGESSYPADISLSIDDLVEITARVVNRLDLDNLVLIGHSMGGLIGLLYAEKYEKNVGGFIDVEGNLSSEDCFFSRQITEVDFETFCRNTLPDFVQRLKQAENIGSRRYIGTLEKYKPFKAMYDYSHSLVKYSDDGALIERFASLNIPKLFVYGSDNRGLTYIPLLRHLGCKIREISGSGHSPHYDNPDEFYDTVCKFLRIL